VPPAGFEPAFPEQPQDNPVRRKLAELTAERDTGQLADDLQQRIPKPIEAPLES
jgi:hypothetical protein